MRRRKKQEELTSWMQTLGVQCTMHIGFPLGMFGHPGWSTSFAYLCLWSTFVLPFMRCRTASFECLVRIGMDYYEHLRGYMTELFSITVRAAREDEEPVAL